MTAGNLASIVVPTLNRCDTLEKCLDSLARQRSIDGRHVEIVVVDNGSTDATKEVAGRAAEGSPLPVRYILETEPGLLAGRHRGTLDSTGDILIFVDDDIEADPDWLRAILDTFLDSDVMLVGGPSLPKYEMPPPKWLEGFWTGTSCGGRACSWLSLLDIGDLPLDIPPTLIWGLNFAIRRSALLSLGGFHPDCIPSDLQCYQGDGETGLSLKAKARGYRARYQPKAKVHHLIPNSRLTVEYFMRRAFYQGVCDSYSDIRKEHGLYASAPAQRLDLRRLAAATRRAFGPAVRLILATLGLRRRSAALQLSPQEEVLRGIKEKVAAAKVQGYAFHRDAMKLNAAVQAWALRPDYWDYRLPEGREDLHTAAARKVG